MNWSEHEHGVVFERRDRRRHTLEDLPRLQFYILDVISMLPWATLDINRDLLGIQYSPVDMVSSTSP